VTPVAAFDEIPVVDLSAWEGGPEARAALAERVRDICHEVGFFHLVGHGIEPAFLADHAAARAAFFALPEAVKAGVDKVASPHFRGWEREGAELTNGRPDIREQLDLATENPSRGAGVLPAYLRLDGPNQWLPEAELPGFRDHLDRFLLRMGEVADRVMEVISVGLGLEAGHLRAVFGERPMSLVKLIRYPATPAGAAGVNPHHDAGFLTLLLQHEVAGLQALNPAGEWIDVEPTPGAFVVNLGENLQEMTGNYVVATTHRVITGAPRFSSGYFHGPDLTTRLDPLPLDPSFAAAVVASERHRSAGFMARRPRGDAELAEITADAGAGVYGQQLWNYYCRSYPDNVARHHADAFEPAG
jgi:isopenicillin N synthase-like dioxygenase